MKKIMLEMMQNNKVKNKPHKINYLPLLSHVWIVQLFSQVLYLLILLFSYFPTENKQGTKLQTQIEIVRFLSREKVLQAGLDHATFAVCNVCIMPIKNKSDLAYNESQTFTQLGRKDRFPPLHNSSLCK